MQIRAGQLSLETVVCCSIRFVLQIGLGLGKQDIDAFGSCPGDDGNWSVAIGFRIAMRFFFGYRASGLDVVNALTQNGVSPFALSVNMVMGAVSEYLQSVDSLVHWILSLNVDEFQQALSSIRELQRRASADRTASVTGGVVPADHAPAAVALFAASADRADTDMEAFDGLVTHLLRWQRANQAGTRIALLINASGTAPRQLIADAGFSAAHVEQFQLRGLSAADALECLLTDWPAGMTSEEERTAAVMSTIGAQCLKDLGTEDNIVPRLVAAFRSAVLSSEWRGSDTAFLSGALREVGSSVLCYDVSRACSGPSGSYSKVLTRHLPNPAGRQQEGSHSALPRCVVWQIGELESAALLMTCLCCSFRWTPS